MKYLKIYTDFTEDMKKLKDAEKGRLFDCMLIYAASGREIDLPGNEAFIWPGVKKNIDVQSDKYREKCDSMDNARGKNSKVLKSEKKLLKTEKKLLKSTEEQDQEQDQEQEQKKRNKKNSSTKTALDIAIDDFVSYRKLLKKPLTSTGINRLKGELEKLAPGDDEKKIAILEQSQYKGWIGVFQLKDDTQELQGDGMDNLRRLYEANRNE